MDHFSYSSILIDIHIFYNLSTNLLIRAKSNQRNMTTCCNNTYPRDDDHLSSRGCRHSAWKKTKLSFSSCSLIACALVFFSYLFFVHSYNRTKRELFRKNWTSLYKIFLNNTFGNKRINVFTEIEWVLFDLLYCYIHVSMSNILTRIYLKKNCSACDDYVRLITVTVEAAQA